MLGQSSQQGSSRTIGRRWINRRAPPSQKAGSCKHSNDAHQGHGSQRTERLQTTKRQQGRQGDQQHPKRSRRRDTRKPTGCGQGLKRITQQNGIRQAGSKTKDHAAERNDPRRFSSLDAFPNFSQALGLCGMDEAAVQSKGVGRKGTQNGEDRQRWQQTENNKRMKIYKHKS